MSSDTAIVDTYRRQVADCVDHLSSALARAARVDDPFAIEVIALQLEGVRFLTLRLRDALLTAPAGAGRPRTSLQANDKGEGDVVA